MEEDQSNEESKINEYNDRQVLMKAKEMAMNN